jgi:uncharacterized damage-inducible protein DinB
MDSTTAAPDRQLTRAEQAVEAMRRERLETIREFAKLTDEQLRQRIEWRGGQQAVSFRIQAFIGHLVDHQQHLLRLRFARGQEITELEHLMMKAQAALAEFEVMCLALDDEGFTAQGPNEGDWSAEQILEHVLQTERDYRARILAGLEAAAVARAAGAGTGS